MSEAEPRTIRFGATPNGNTKVGGWFPFVVDRNPIYKTPWVYGTTYTDYRSATYERKSDAILAAKAKALEHHASEGDILQEVEGCSRCWNDADPRHIEKRNGRTHCVPCGRIVNTTDLLNESSNE